MLSGLISEGDQLCESPVCLVTGLTQVDNITIMQLSNPLQNSLQDFFTGSQGI